MNIWYCPQGKAFMRALCRTLAKEVEHVVVSLPERHIPSFLTEFSSYGRKSLGPFMTVQIEDGRPLAESLMPAFQTEGRDVVLLEDFPELQVKKGSTIVLRFPSHLSANRQECAGFLEIMAAHAKACKDRRESPPWNLIALMPAQLPLPREEIGLKTFVWWGKLRPSDLEYAVEQTLEGLALNEAAYYWYYALCKGLAVMDPGLVEAIVSNPPVSARQLVEVVQGHELLRNDVGELARRYYEMGQSGINRQTLPHGIEATLWHLGALDIDCYGNPALHPAALVAAGLETRLETLLVQGQMQVYLPLVQEVHSFLCRMLEKRFGADWGKKNTQKYDSVESEIGKLPFYMKEFFRRKISQELIDLAFQWREVRNTIAHGSIIPCKLALIAVARYKEFRTSI